MHRRITYANVTATLALVLAMSGGAVAANHYLVNSTKQISPKVLKKLTGKTGKAGKPGATGATGAQGPATGPAGGDLTGTYPNPTVRGGAVTPSKTGSFPGARVEASAQSVNNGEYLPLSFEAPDFNVGGVFSSGAPTKLTAPITGIYVVTGHAEWSSGGIGWRQLEIDRTSDGFRLATSLIPVAATQFTYSTVATVAKLNAGDGVQLKANQTSGGALSVGHASFAMTWSSTGS